MIRDPLQNGIGEDQIERRGAAPVRNIGIFKIYARQPRARFRQHVVGRIKAENIGARKSVGEKLGGIAWTATQIDDAIHRPIGDARKEIERRSRSLGFELQILARAPIFQGASP
jgi:hypothetical protein